MFALRIGTQGHTDFEIRPIANPECFKTLGKHVYFDVDLMLSECHTRLFLTLQRNRVLIRQPTDRLSMYLMDNYK
jgi:hypothetical protein